MPITPTFLCPKCGELCTETKLTRQYGACPACRAEETRSLRPARKPTSGIAAIVIACASVAGVLFLLAFLIWISPKPKDDPKPARPSFGIGERAVLAGKEGRYVILGVTQGGYGEASRAKDTHELAVIIRAGVAFSVPVGTKVSVIDRAFQMRKVRVLDGKHEGRTGWIPPEELNAP